jgi:hypothetical protein
MCAHDVIGLQDVRSANAQDGARIKIAIPDQCVNPGSLEYRSYMGWPDGIGEQG